MKKTDILSKSLVVDFGRFKLLKYHIKLPNEVETDFIIRESGEYSVIIPKIDKNTFLMIKQHRVGANKISIEFPMGNVEGKTSLEMATTELKEETGYTAAHIEKIFDFYISPGWSNQKGNLFVAEGLVKGETDMELYEYIENIEIKISDIETMIKNGEIFDMTTIGCFYRYKSIFGPSNGSFG
jgi:ADP-ribose pyrophosphatase